ncbi:hypothetical protein [Brunnivagina elsteri]|uniref:hypothetical protein n=1 Tax=Brunnivagina elsteri TaxID=1247191 RepID=UPI001B80D728|nr:hypothetical protein [Calothrix elsteri]
MIRVFRARFYSNIAIWTSELTAIKNALNEEAKQFYEKCGFTPSIIAPMTLMVTINDAKVALGIVE